MPSQRLKGWRYRLHLPIFFGPHPCFQEATVPRCPVRFGMVELICFFLALDGDCFYLRRRSRDGASIECKP